MELSKIENLLQKYEDAETTIAEENELKLYFSSNDVAQHLQHYCLVFDYYVQAKQDQFSASIPLQSKHKNIKWIGIAATVSLLFGLVFFITLSKPNEAVVTDLGTFNNPETALKETQKALALLSNHVNAGIESVNYVTEYQKSKERIFN